MTYVLIHGRAVAGVPKARTSKPHPGTRQAAAELPSLDAEPTTKRIMPPKVSEDNRPTEDDLARAKLGPRGVPGQPDPAKMAPQREKKTPEVGKFDGHTA